MVGGEVDPNFSFQQPIRGGDERAESMSSEPFTCLGGGGGGKRMNKGYTLTFLDPLTGPPFE